MSNQDQIIYFDTAGKEVGREQASNAQRISMRAAANERKMATYKKAHPEVARAHCEGASFSFTADGRSRFERFLKD